MSDAIGGHLQAVLEKIDAPAEYNDHEQGAVTQVFQVAIPGIGHEHIGTYQQHNGKNLLHNASVIDGG